MKWNFLENLFMPAILKSHFDKQNSTIRIMIDIMKEYRIGFVILTSVSDQGTKRPFLGYVTNQSREKCPASHIERIQNEHQLSFSIKENIRKKLWKRRFCWTLAWSLIQLIHDGKSMQSPRAIDGRNRNRTSLSRCKYKPAYPIQQLCYCLLIIFHVWWSLRSSL